MPTSDCVNRLNGVVYTPADVASEITRIGLEELCSETAQILEPSAGDGAFLKSLVTGGVREENITAIDIDAEATKQLRATYSCASVIETDFIEYALDPHVKKFDLIIGNPPFIKRVSYSCEFRQRLEVLAKRCGFPRAELKNAWAAFVVAAAMLVKANGLLALIVPYEMMTVKYAGKVQAHLLGLGFDTDIFVPDQRAFPTIEQDAVVLVAKLSGGNRRGVRVNRVAECSNLEAVRTATIDQDNIFAASIDKKSVLMDPDSTKLLYELRDRMGYVSDYCSSAPGIVTAANSQFILSEQDTIRRKLVPWARRIVKKGSYLSRGAVFAEWDFVEIARTEPCNLIDFFWEEGPVLSDEAEGYLRECEAIGIQNRYKCRRRRPWYRIPIVPAADGLFFKRAHILPRFCINSAGVLVTDTAYQVRMKENIDIRDFCFSFYNTITLLFAEIEGRFYGGGVLEITPEEFKGLPFCLLKPTDEQFLRFSNLFPEAGTEIYSKVWEADDYIRQELRMSKNQMSMVTSTLKVLRAHRLRHGARRIVI